MIRDKIKELEERIEKLEKDNSFDELTDEISEIFVYMELLKKMELK